MYDNGIKESNISAINARNEIALIYFKPLKQYNGRRQFRVALPKLTSSLMYELIGSENDIEKSKLWLEMGDHNRDNIFETKLPYFNSETQSYVLHFSEFIQWTSIKNFQLIDQNSDTIFLEFGKMDKNEFLLRFRHPFSILNAFGIALAIFDKT